MPTDAPSLAERCPRLAKCPLFVFNLLLRDNWVAQQARTLEAEAKMLDIDAGSEDGTTGILVPVGDVPELTGELIRMYERLTAS